MPASKYVKKWTPEEDAKMKELVKIHGLKKWCTIAESLPGRTGKQCRERYIVFFDVLGGTINWILLSREALGLQKKKRHLGKHF